MSESKEPLLHIRGTVSEKDYTDAVRASGLRYFLKYTIIYLAAMLVVDLGISLYYALPDLQNGRLTAGDWLKTFPESLFRGLAPFIILGFLVLFGVYVLVIRPTQMRKRFRELYPHGAPVDYAFGEEEIVIHSFSETVSDTYRLKYADVQRKIRDRKYMFTLITGQKNRTGLFKCVMTPQEVERVRALLQERCPQCRPKA